MRRCVFWFTAVAVVTSLTLMMSVAQSQAPPRDKDEAKAKLDALEKRLPDILAKFKKSKAGEYAFSDRLYEYRPTVRLVRRLAPDRAKVTFVMEFWATGPMEDRVPKNDELASVQLAYCDGAWTTTGIDTTFSAEDDRFGKKARWLMLAIDEDGGR